MSTTYAVTTIMQAVHSDPVVSQDERVRDLLTRRVPQALRTARSGNMSFGAAYWGDPPVSMTPAGVSQSETSDDFVSCFVAEVLLRQSTAMPHGSSCGTEVLALPGLYRARRQVQESCIRTPSSRC